MLIHPALTVRVAEHERDDPARTAWRLQHAAETFAVVSAYFDADDSGRPIQGDDGTYTIHVPVSFDLPTALRMCAHEGFALVQQSTAEDTVRDFATRKAMGKTGE